MTALSADRPSTDPNEDLFGHAPFAKSLAESICRYPGSDGLVLALYGPWGSGKSTVLSYVRYYLEQRPEKEQPVVVPFNPWWFSGQEHLARAFFGQLQAVLPDKFTGVTEKLRQKLADFSEGVGGVLELVGAAAGVDGVAMGALNLIAPKPKDVPAIKDEIAKMLREEGKRVLVVVDDIDRLAPEEVRQLFTVIKALADFPNVIYLLAFDRGVAVDAINQQTGLPGERFLEKIIQVPFDIPPSDRESLRIALFQRIDEVLVDTPEGMFDPYYWSSVFFDGIDPLIEVPRDIVRFANTLLVTYPSVVGEVNPVDFIAIEALRVFVPVAYDAVRSNPEQFLGHSNHSLYGETAKAARQKFHEALINAIAEKRRAATKALLRSIFPNYNGEYGGEWSGEWRKNQRVCVPELFPIYFRLSLPSGLISRSAILRLLGLGDDTESLGVALVDASHKTRPNGLSLARLLLERLEDYVDSDIPDEHIANFINALLDVGDKLILSTDVKGVTDFGNETRIMRLVYNLLKRRLPEERVQLLQDACVKGAGIRVQVYLVDTLDRLANGESSGGTEPLTDAGSLECLKAICVKKIKLASAELLTNPKLPLLLRAWRSWGDPSETRAWCNEVTVSDDDLLIFLSQFIYHSETTSGRGVRRRARLNPKTIEDYLETQAVAERLAAMTMSEDASAETAITRAAFFAGLELIKAGKDPDGIFVFDD